MTANFVITAVPLLLFLWVIGYIYWVKLIADSNGLDRGLGLGLGLGFKVKALRI